jgi:hypothetical protein
MLHLIIFTHATRESSLHPLHDCTTSHSTS